MLCFSLIVSPLSLSTIPNSSFLSPPFLKLSHQKPYLPQPPPPSSTSPFIPPMITTIFPTLHTPPPRSPHPSSTATAGSLVAVIRPKLMGESGFSDYQVYVSEKNRAHPGPVSGSITMKRGGQISDDAVSDEAKVVLANKKVVEGNSSCTMAMGMIVFYHTLSPPPKPPPWPYEIDGIGDKWYRFISCCRYVRFPFTYVHLSLQAGMFVAS